MTKKQILDKLESSINSLIKSNEETLELRGGDHDWIEGRINGLETALIVVKTMKLNEIK